ncbi:MAG: CRISPR system precrRNA processing endoribonuclease RAMP protein Cas6 [candidate division WOR-3 bacterium]
MRIAEFSVKMKAKEKMTLPPYKGFLLRGAFGLAFRKISCPFPEKECSACLLKAQCVYSYIFETPRPENSEIMRKYPNVPHPFLLEPPLENKTEYQTGDPFSFNLILLGKAIDYLPYFIYSFEEMAQKGLGKDRGRLEIESLNQGKEIIYDGKTKTIKSKIKEEELKIEKRRKPVKEIKIKLLTPLRIIYQGKTAQNLDFHIVMRNLLRRLGLISYFHSPVPFPIAYQDLIKKAMAIKTRRTNFQILDLTRYSSRQERRIKLEGLIGEVTYEGDLTEFIPYLKIGERIHIGKGTVFGFGKYKLSILPARRGLAFDGKENK